MMMRRKMRMGNTKKKVVQNPRRGKGRTFGAEER